MKQYRERNIMTNRLMLTGLLCCVLGTTGCYASRDYYGGEVCADGICTSNQEYNAVCVENADGYSECSDPNGPVNYTRNAADFRAYGERTPRDHRVTQAGAGNNISAVVIPDINDEVVEQEINVGNVAPFASGPEAAPQDMAGDDPNGDWLAEEGQSLRDLLNLWSEEAGWRLIWKTNRNYTLNAGAMFRGSFADVASALVRAFARAKPAPVATFYKGNRVLVIETLEDENAYD